MEISFIELENGIGLIKLGGSLDIMGVGEIETKFAAYCSGNKTRVIVDLSNVVFLASIGIRMLITSAKSVSNRGGKMALLNPPSAVHEILEVTGIPSIIPIYAKLESAETVLLAS